MSTPATPSITNPAAASQLLDPATLDILPPLHTILSRLLLPSPTSPEDANGKPPSSFTTTPQGDPLNPQNLGPLEIQNLSTAAAALKVRLAKSRQSLLRLSDMDRTLEDQEEEIAELEGQLKTMRETLQNMKKSSLESDVKRDVDMA